MSNKLIIDTSKQNTYIILTYNDILLERTLNEKMKVSENLLPEIDGMLTMAGIVLSDLDFICVVLGPGSFTGIRVGIATAKAFAQTLNLKFVAKNSFEVMSDVVDNGVLLMKCTNTSLYCAKYENSQIKEESVISNDEVSKLNDYKIYQIINEECVNIEDSCIVDNYAELLNIYMEKCVNEGDFADPNTIEPYYLQLSQAELALKDKKN